MKTNLYVIRDDGDYDYKGNFKTFKEANDYRLKCQNQWINHCDFVILEILSDTGRFEKAINLTRKKYAEIQSILLGYNIPME